MFKRMIICIFNILFPPVAVMLLTGLNGDVLLNSLLFLFAVIPSHIHGFYISATYFNRKRKVSRGIYPGKPRRMIYSERVNNGGASRREMEVLRGEKETQIWGKRGSGRLSGKVEKWDDGSEKFYDERGGWWQSMRGVHIRSQRGDDGNTVE